MKQDIIKIVSAKLPTKFGIFEIIVYKGIKDGLEHAVLLRSKKFTSFKENKYKNPTLVRIHSQCLTGDTFSSLKCDCGEQLMISLKRIGKMGGVLIYLNQEGRGIGFTNKIKAYALQDKGLDTIEANKKLGFAPDLREYKVAAQILKDLGIHQIVLLTNNPDKTSQLMRFGITITKCIPLEVAPNKINKSYLKAKKDKLGHNLKLV